MWNMSKEDLDPVVETGSSSVLNSQTTKQVMSTMSVLFVKFVAGADAECHVSSLNFGGGDVQ